MCFTVICNCGFVFRKRHDFNLKVTSASWHFEKQHNWSGLLVEPMPSLFDQLVTKNRSAWAIRTCLSTKRRPETIRFSLGGSTEETQPGILGDGASGVGEMAPLSSLSISVLLINDQLMQVR